MHTEEDNCLIQCRLRSRPGNDGEDSFFSFDCYIYISICFISFQPLNFVHACVHVCIGVYTQDFYNGMGSDRVDSSKILNGGRTMGSVGLKSPR